MKIKNLFKKFNKDTNPTFEEEKTIFDYVLFPYMVKNQRNIYRNNEIGNEQALLIHSLVNYYANILSDSAIHSQSISDRKYCFYMNYEIVQEIIINFTENDFKSKEKINYRGVKLKTNKKVKKLKTNKKVKKEKVKLNDKKMYKFNSVFDESYIPYLIDDFSKAYDGILFNRFGHFQDLTFSNDVIPPGIISVFDTNKPLIFSAIAYFILNPNSKIEDMLKGEEIKGVLKKPCNGDQFFV